METILEVEDVTLDFSKRLTGKELFGFFGLIPPGG
jgi:hypothetical protein